MDGTTMTIRSIYGLKEKAQKVSCGKSMTQQHFKAECDINTIIKRYETTGSWSGDMRIPTSQPQFGDYTAVPDLQTAQNMILEGRDAFDALPARVRKMFDNDALAYLDFMSDVNNLDTAIEMGLVSESDADVIRARIEAAKPKPKKKKAVEEPAVEPVPAE